MKRHRIPVIVGAGQFTQSKNTENPMDPMGMMANAGRIALSNTGTPAIKKMIDSVYVVNIQSYSYEDAPGLWAAVLGITPHDTFYSAMGGNSPQMLVCRAAKAIASGESRAVLIGGGESVYANRRAAKGEVMLNWPERKFPKRVDGNERRSLDDVEEAYGLLLPTIIYPLFETALRGAAGRSLEAHRRHMGSICEHLTRIAAQNPYSWIQTFETGDVLTAPTAENRYIAYPYTKRMVANMFVDQSAALVMTSEETAESLGIEPSRWVYPMGKAELNDVWYVSRRRRIHESVALAKGAQTSLERAGIGIDDIDVFDLYSCFPCAVEMGRHALGLSERDARDLSVTGGLPYFGGPMNNYSMHAVATVIDYIQKGRSRFAMVTATGWYMTKHAIVVYGTKPGPVSWEDMEDSAIQASIDEEALPGAVKEAAGRLTVEAYTVIHDGSGRPERGLVLGRLSDGRRALADIDDDSGALIRWEEEELVGKRGEVRFDRDSGRNRVTF
ncbi:MAG: acetyl-CoA acetyltransferase [Desulfobacterales bacterium]